MTLSWQKSLLWIAKINRMKCEGLFSLPHNMTWANCFRIYNHLFIFHSMFMLSEQTQSMIYSFICVWWVIHWNSTLNAASENWKGIRQHEKKKLRVKSIWWWNAILSFHISNHFNKNNIENRDRGERESRWNFSDVCGKWRYKFVQWPNQTIIIGKTDK